MKTLPKLIVLLAVLCGPSTFGQLKLGESLKKAVCIVKVFDKDGNFLSKSPGVTVSPDGNCVVTADVFSNRNIATAMVLTGKNSLFQVKNILVSDPISNTLLLSLHNTDKIVFDYVNTVGNPLNPGDEVKLLEVNEDMTISETKKVLKKSSFVAGLGNLSLFDKPKSREKGGLTVVNPSLGVLGFSFISEDGSKAGFVGIQNLVKRIPYAVSIADWQKTGARDPLLASAITWLADENYNEAITLANQSLALFPASGPMNFVRGYAKYNTKEYVGAITDLNAAAENGYTSQHLYCVRAHSKYLYKDYMGALSDYNKIVDSSMMDGVFCFRRGSCRFLANDYKGAINDLSASTKLGNNDPQTWFKLGVAHKEMREFPQAILALSKAQGVGLKEAGLFNAIGLCYFNVKDYRHAAENLQVAYNLGEKTPITLSGLGISMFEIGNYSASVSYINQAINKGANDKKLKAYRANAIASAGF